MCLAIFVLGGGKGGVVILQLGSMKVISNEVGPGFKLTHSTGYRAYLEMLFYQPVQTVTEREFIFFFTVGLTTFWGQSDFMLMLDSL